MTDEIKCQVCNGSGYVGPKQADDTPSMDRIIGCAPCSFCKGGYTEAFVWTGDKKAELNNALQVVFDRELEADTLKKAINKFKADKTTGSMFEMFDLAE